VRTRLLPLLCSAVLLLTLATPAAAILNGTPDGLQHPAVGGLVTQVETADGPVNVLICSGTMISPNVFVTAAHCTDILDELELPAFVTLDSEFDYTDPDTLYPGEQHTHPLFGLSFPDTYDVGVVVLDGTGVTPTLGAGFNYPDLAPLGYLDGLAKQRGQKEMTLTAVGYGSFGFASKGVNYEPLYDDVRRFAAVKFVNTNGGFADGWNLKHSGNPGQDRGSTCHGDSGGPVLHGDVVVAITSFGIANQCAGNGYAFRADIETTHTFVNQFLP
jgi:hypothetical protein